MLYLFNSGYSPKHRVNILNTLFLPSGSSNMYRYREPYINPELFASPHDAKDGELCTVVFVDRFKGPTYEFIPVRNGRLRYVEKSGDHLFFHVCLGDFIFPKDPVAFNTEILEALRELGLPARTSEDGLERDDGRFVIQDSNFCSSAENFVSGDTAWDNLVDELSTRRAFSDSKNAVFLKCGVKTDTTPLGASAWLSPTRFRFAPGSSYTVEISYKYPELRGKMSGGIEVEIKTTPNLIWNRDTLISINAPADKFQSIISPKRYPEERQGSFSISSVDSFPDVLLPDAPIEFLIKQGSKFWLLLIGGLVLLSLTSVLTSSDWESFKPFSADFWASNGLKTVGAFVHSAILVFLLYHVGKKAL